MGANQTLDTQSKAIVYLRFNDMGINAHLYAVDFVVITSPSRTRIPEL
jgi:hypothetical protein